MDLANHNAPNAPRLPPKTFAWRSVLEPLVMAGVCGALVFVTSRLIDVEARVIALENALRDLASDASCVPVLERNVAYDGPESSSQASEESKERDARVDGAHEEEGVGEAPDASTAGGVAETATLTEQRASETGPDTVESVAHQIDATSESAIE